jgi:hypothetical protein
MALLSRCRSAMVEVGRGLELSDRAAPSPAERAYLAARADLLRESLAPSSKEEAASMVAGLFAVIPVGRDEGENQAKQIALYASLLMDEPPWAIAAACRGCVDAGARFRPSAPELVAAARRAAQRVREEHYRIEQVLNAKVVHERTEEERAASRERIQEMLRGALASMSA